MTSSTNSRYDEAVVMFFLKRTPFFLFLGVISAFGFFHLSSSAALAAYYYVDNGSGNDSAAGTSEGAAWKSLSKVNGFNFQPGDVVHFKRGGKWDGPLQIKKSGTATAPIRFTMYGSTGGKPIITGLSASGKKRAVEILASWIVFEEFRVEDATDGGVEIFEGHATTKVPYDNNTVRKVDFVNVGIGVTIKSNNNLVEDSTFTDLKMVRNTTTPKEDDYGAIAVNLNGGAAKTNIGRNNLSNNRILSNKVLRAKAPSHDYTFDGGFIEIFEDVDNTEIAYNWVEDSKGFIEIGGTMHDAKVENLKIHHNISVNNSLFSFVNTGTYGIGIANFQMHHNLIHESASGTKTAFWFDGNASIGPNEFQLKNNIIATKASISNKNSFTHENNIYFRLDRAADQSNVTEGDIGYPLHASEKKADPLFLNASGKNFSLQASSPAIDKGQVLGYTQDYSKKSLRGAPDIGPNEFADGSGNQNQSGECKQDINQDGAVNQTDFQLLTKDFFKKTPSVARTDINQDGAVNILDYSLFLQKFLKQCP